jgi:signal transduction histidine kinase
LVILRSKLKEGVAVEQRLSDDLPKIEALGSELNQVWTNIIDNAVQAMGGQGTLRLSTTRGDQSVLVEIEDDGPGIEQELQSQVFDAFFTTKPPGEGTGLGLHTTYNIVVEKHGGAIRLDSEPGSTRFTIELPLRLQSPDDSGEAVVGPAEA